MITMLHVIERLADFGGTPTKLLYLAKYLDRTRCRLAFFCFLPSPLAQEFERNGVVVRQASTVSVARLTRMIASEARRLRADVICTHFTRALVTGYLASRACGLPLLHNEHSSAFYRRGMARHAAMWCIRSAEAVVCNSEYTRATIGAAYQVPSRKLRVLYNPVEERTCGRTRNEVRAALGAAPGDPVICHVGGMIAERDQATLLRAFGIVHSRRPRARLLIIGDGPVRGELESLVRGLGLESHVVLLGYTPSVGEYLAAADIYVNPTRDEGFGIAVVEAMLAKLPVVLSQRGAHPELIRDGETGLLFPSGDAVGLAQRLARLVDHPEAASDMGISGFRDASRRFSPSKYAGEYVRLVETIVTSAPSPGASAQEVI